MKSRFEQIVESTQKRRRWLNSLRACSWALTISTGLTLGYLLLSSFGFVPQTDWILLVIANLGAALAGILYGRNRAIDIRQSLYQTDRTLGLGEKLTTLHELREERAHSEFLPMLEARVERLRIESNRVFTFSPRDKQRWIGVGALLASSVTIVFLLSDMSPIQIPGTVQALKKQQEEQAKGIEFRNLEEPKVATLPSTTPASAEAIAAQIKQLGERIDQLSRTPSSPEEAQARKNEIDQLKRQLQEAEKQLQESTGGKTGGGAAGPNRNSASGKSSNQNSASKQTQGNSMTSPNGRRGGEEQPIRGSPTNQPSSQQAQLKKNLENIDDQLKKDNPNLDKLRDAIRKEREKSNDSALNDLLKEAENAPDKESAKQALEKAIQHLQERQDASQQNGDEQSSPDSPRASNEAGKGQQGNKSPEKKAGNGKENNDDANLSNGTNFPRPGQGQAGHDPALGEEGGDRESKGTEAGNGKKAGGNQAGKGAGDKSFSELPFNLPLDTPNLMDVSGKDLPNPEILMSFLTQGTPLDNVNPGQGQRPVLSVNYSKVDTALDLLGVPPEMRDEILNYFLSLSQGTTSQPSDKK
ncbi:hypothetical protein HYR54_14515 [Candidatus Acetothermia bacterium]|nr:hypothetical protein [Candidatus Acetothermia bacterium]